MTGTFGMRAPWLYSWAAIGALLAVVPQSGRTADDPREWLQKMNHALASRNYDGTFFHLSQGRVETMRILHRVHGTQVTERLLSLDGSGREFLRANDTLTCYLPDRRTVLVEPRQVHGPFLGSLPQFGPEVAEFYRIEALPSTRLLGRNTRVIAVAPKDQFRFGYRLWLDESTAMPLKTQLCDARGQVIEQILFARLDMRENIADAELAPAVHTEGMHWIHQPPADDNASAALSAYRASELPPGFRLKIAGAQILGDATAPASHLVYSDGLATVSVGAVGARACVSFPPRFVTHPPGVPPAPRPGAGAGGARLSPVFPSWLHSVRGDAARAGCAAGCARVGGAGLGRGRRFVGAPALRAQDPGADVRRGAGLPRPSRP